MLDGVSLKKVRGDDGEQDEYLDESAIDLSAQQQRHLACMNDDGGSFEVIADYIEKQLMHAEAA
jgi:hypothetical protein